MISVKHTAFLNCPTDFIQLMNKMENVRVLKYSEIGEKIFLTDKTIKLIKNGEVIRMNEKDLIDLFMMWLIAKKEIIQKE